jgi:hypothetical protein
MAISFIVPEVSSSFHLLYFSSHPRSSAIHFTEYFFFSFLCVLFLYFQNHQELSNKIVIPTDQPHLQCLGPLGDPDPTDLINAETNRIPFRTENFSLDLWKDTFRSWPSPTVGWKDWFLRVSNSNEVQWGERKLDQCIRLSIADMHRNESLLIAASYFWSDTLNAFVFGHGPASPTLADVAMLTGLDISSADSTHFFDTAPSAKVETRSIGGWSGYIQKYRGTGPVSIKEQTTFLNMWLDKFVFCGRSAGPTSVYLSAAERLANGGRFPLGRYLLGAAYHLLHQVAKKLLLGQSTGNLGGPWWFINMWLNLHLHKRLNFNLFTQRFPRDITEKSSVG